MIMTNCKDCTTNCVYRGKDNEARCGSFVGTVTNADHIRAMSDEELANWFCNSVTMECCYDTCPARHICSGDDNGMLKWLKQPFEGE